MGNVCLHGQTTEGNQRLRHRQNHEMHTEMFHYNPNSIDAENLRNSTRITRATYASDIKQSLRRRTNFTLSYAINKTTIQPEFSMLKDQNCVNASRFGLNGAICQLIQYEGQTLMMHQKILDYLGYKPNDMLQQRNRYVQRIAEKQIINMNNGRISEYNLEMVEEIINFIESNSNRFKEIHDLEFVEDYVGYDVFQCKTPENQELMILVPTPQRFGFNDLICQTQLLSLLKNPHVCTLYEEIIEINPENNLLLGYLAILEKPQVYLQEFLECDLNYMEQHGIYHGEMSEVNLYISEDLQLKVFNFQLAILHNLNYQEKSYQLNGFNKMYSSKRLRELYQQNPLEFFNKQWKFPELIQLERQSVIEIFEYDNMMNRLPNDEIQNFAKGLFKAFRENPNLNLDVVKKSFEEFYIKHRLALLRILVQFEVLHCEVGIKQLCKFLIQLSKKQRDLIFQAIVDIIESEKLVSMNTNLIKAKKDLLEALKTETNLLKMPILLKSRAHYALSVIERQAGNTNECLKHLENAKEFCADKQLLLQINEDLAQVYRQKGKLKKALDFYFRALYLSKKFRGDLDSRTLELYVNICEMQSMTGSFKQFDDTVQSFFKIIEDFQPLHESQQQFKRQKSKETPNGFTLFVQERPDIIRRLIKCFKRRGDTDQTIEFLQKFKRKSLNEEAIEALNQYIRLKETLVGDKEELISLYMDLAALYREVDDYQKSSLAIVKVIQILKNKEQNLQLADKYIMLAEDCQKQNETERAIEFLNEAIIIQLNLLNGDKSQIKIQETMLKLADAHIQMVQIDKAKSLLQELIQLRDEDELHYGKQELLPLYRRLVEITVNDSQAHEEYLFTYLKLAQEHDSNNVQTLNWIMTMLADQFYSQGDLESALHYEQQAYSLTLKNDSLNTQRCRSLRRMGEILIYMGDYIKGIDKLSQAIKEMKDVTKQGQRDAFDNDILEIKKILKKAKKQQAHE